MVVARWIYHYLFIQCLSPLTFWVRIPFMARCTRNNCMWYVCQWLAQVGGFLGVLHLPPPKTGPACVSNVRVIELSEKMGIILWITATFNVKTCHTVTLQSIAYNCAAHSVLGNINDFITIVNIVNNNSLTRGLNRRWNGRPHRCKQWEQLWNFKYQFSA
jgi:hypothetical protein